MGCFINSISAQQKINITADFQNTPLSNALSSIEGQTDYLFYYKQDWISPYSVTANFKDTPLATALTTIFKETELNYIIRENASFSLKIL